MAKGITLNIIQKAKKIRLFLMDVDGVLTDGKLYYYENGSIGRAFHIHDGMGIELAHLAGLTTGVISAKDSPSIKNRMEELKIKYIYLGADDKKAIITTIVQHDNFSLEEIAYIGDDLIDIPVFTLVGLSFAVANATKNTKLAADYVTYSEGGNGAVREALELILKAQGLFDNLIATYQK
ncbi:MAG: hypothetical protein A2Y62_22230 [Candidatus Fischerbacteria bacterium RBG_13_37_8]|uniref:3-deoxy-D-manno-octulosonate 8-phosphate phosphatase n=1 Tax=Candidatus Fischerbacteria bacterium RBG_13_37_8 TaxID=1817863 RepID=A0A1F5VJK5_9BACT|nr:MAG: hypothetical protein A2Y62_22230 [Candidatus Fischerbacteria bacterium RBG_13_37_8]